MIILLIIISIIGFIIASAINEEDIAGLSPSVYLCVIYNWYIPRRYRFVSSGRAIDEKIFNVSIRK